MAFALGLLVGLLAVLPSACASAGLRGASVSTQHHVGAAGVHRQGHAATSEHQAAEVSGESGLDSADSAAGRHTSQQQRATHAYPLASAGTSAHQPDQSDPETKHLGHPKLLDSRDKVAELHSSGHRVQDARVVDLVLQPGLTRSATPIVKSAATSEELAYQNSSAEELVRGDNRQHLMSSRHVPAGPAHEDGASAELQAGPQHGGQRSAGGRITQQQANHVRKDESKRPAGPLLNMHAALSAGRITRSLLHSWHGEGGYGVKEYAQANKQSLQGVVSEAVSTGSVGARAWESSSSQGPSDELWPYSHVHNDDGHRQYSWQYNGGRWGRRARAVDDGQDPGERTRLW